MVYAINACPPHSTPTGSKSSPEPRALSSATSLFSLPLSLWMLSTLTTLSFFPVLLLEHSTNPLTSSLPLLSSNCSQRSDFSFPTSSPSYCHHQDIPHQHNATQRENKSYTVRMNSDLNLPPKDMKPLTHSTQPPTETPSPHINRPESNQHASQPESVASVSQYFAPIQLKFDEECDNFEQHLRQDCDEFASIQKEIIESSDALADRLLARSRLQEQLHRVKKGKAAQMESKLETLDQQRQDHFREYTQLRRQRDFTAKQKAEEYQEQHILPLELQIHQLEADIERLESTDQQIVSIKQEIDSNLNGIGELEKTLEKLMRELRLKAGAAYLDNVNHVLALKAAIAQKDADIAAIREDMQKQAEQFAARMKEQAERFTAQMEHKGAEITALHDEIRQQRGRMEHTNERLNAEIIAIRNEMKQQSGQFRAQSQAQFPSSVIPQNTEELSHLITATQDSLMSVTSLDLTECKLGDKKTDFFKALVKMPNLTSLNLTGSGIGDAGVQVLAASQALANLTALDLRCNNIGAAGAQAIATSAALTKLTSLSLRQNKIGPAGAKALADSTTLTNLTCLNLDINNIGYAGVQVLATSETLANLASFDLSCNNLGDDGVQVLAASPTLAKLTSLDLRYNNIGAAGVQALAASAILTKLTSLDLRYNNNIGDAGVQALAASTAFSNLTTFDLRDNNIGAADAQVIKTKYPFASV